MGSVSPFVLPCEPVCECVLLCVFQVSYLTGKNFADKVREKISSDRTYGPSHYNVTPSQDSMGTTHVSVIAEDGTVVSATSTINQM